MPNKIQPRVPRGMRDILPQKMILRQYVIGEIEKVFQRFGFEPLATPVLELRETLMGKYGPDAEKLIYEATHVEGKEELSLRYDLTVPLTRVIAMYPELVKPFKRYQIAPVWRAERPQKGRYREFFQCDADIVGSKSMLADAEIVTMINAALVALGFKTFVIKINNRKLLTGIGEYSGVPQELLGGLYRAIDKLEKIGADGVRAEMEQ
ncbi:MAG: ATP phosphoribosyltransferase regulatory subunit, partial [Chloroflexi bacterium]|nr:ATP phosphoribosyltransferase regulatory subunit [Chloroflexota bacterium]